MGISRKKDVFERISTYINEEILDIDLKKLVLSSFNYYESYYSLNHSDEDQVMNYIAWITLVIQIKNMKINNFTWTLLCELYNMNYRQLLECFYEEICKMGLKKDVNKLIKLYKSNKSTKGWIKYYRIVSKFFKYFSQNINTNKYNNVLEMKEYNGLLGLLNNITYSDLNKGTEYEKVWNSIISNYPINSSYKMILRVEYTNKINITEIKFTNININTENNIIRNLLENYINHYNINGEPTRKSYKMFIFHFNESIGDITINSIHDFNNKLFYKQYDFYKQLELKYSEIGFSLDRDIAFRNLLINIYRYIIEISSETKEIRFGEAFLKVINNPKRKKFFDEKLKLVLYNKNELPPTENKFVVVPSEYIMNNSDSRNTALRIVDLSNIPFEFAEDIKNYMWYSSIKVYQITAKLKYIIDLIKYREDFIENINTISNYENGKIFPEELLYGFRLMLEEDYSNLNTLDNAFDVIRAYLKYFKEKYKVSDNDFYIFYLEKSKWKYCSNSNPITENDLKLIYKEFLRKENIDSSKRIYTIVFEIFISTNIRIGEILNFKKNCIKNIEANGDGEIKYFSKTSNGDLIEKLVDKKIINLIKDAIRLTYNNYTNNDISKYLFIVPERNKVSNTCRRLNFYSYFSRIIFDLQDNLEIKHYKPYNIRHTFINNVYNEGLKLNLQVIELEKIAGNKYATANKYYRNYDDIETYVEIFSKTIISNVDINGKILTEFKGNLIKSVRNDLGICLNDDCNFNIGECLSCSNFATFVSRIPTYQRFIKKINNEIMNTTNDLYKEELYHTKKLASKYLSELLKVKNGGKVNNE
ncbi:hypothetical protein [Clostridium sp.]|uniref:hypothetical protein n=1 Tax=Clostridium sp. TaxID=1506 RepID=UPI0029134D24|nr:hypothetical protein [Clostridium sp.]MDU7364099.1 hypothetical protein [Clostridium sp.]